MTRARYGAVCLAMSLLACRAEGTWEPVPIYDVRYAPARINEGMQMTHALEFAPSNPDHAYLCTDTSQLWRSVDRGLSWRHMGSGLLVNGCRAIAVDPTDPDRVLIAGFAGVDAQRYKRRPVKGLQGIYLTENGGGDWILVRETDFFRQPGKARLIHVVPSKTGASHQWFAGTYEEGLLRSMDGGRSWDVVANLPGICNVASQPTGDGRMLIATEAGLFGFSSEGIRRLGRGLPVSVCSVAIHPNNPAIVVAAARRHGIFRSVDGGESFDRVADAVFRGADVASVAVSSVEPVSFLAKAHASRARMPFWSHDDGKTWVRGKYSSSLPTERHGAHFWYASAFTSHPSLPKFWLTVSSGDGKVFASTDAGQTWALYGSGYTGARLMSFHASRDTLTFGLTDFSIWEQRRGEDFFRELDVPRYKRGASVHRLSYSSRSLIATVGTWNDQVLVVGNPGTGWRRFSNIHGSFRHLATEGRNVYLDDWMSDDGGDTWRRLEFPVVAVGGNNTEPVWGMQATGDSTVFLQATSAARDWRRATTALPIQSKQVTSVAVDARKHDQLYVGTSGGVWVYRGGQWHSPKTVTGIDKDEFGLNFISSVVADPHLSGHVYAGKAAPARGMSNGIYASRDGGRNWSNISAGLGKTMYVWSLHIDDVERHLYAGIERGIFRMPLLD